MGNPITEAQCELCAKRTKERHDELRSWVRDLSSEVKALRDCLEKKFDKLYTLIISAMGVTLLAVIVAILKEVFRGR